MSGEELVANHYDDFLSDIKIFIGATKMTKVIFADCFLLAFDTRQEDSSGDITRQPFISIIKQVIDFREDNPKLKIKLNITSPTHYFDDLSKEDRALVDDKFGGDDSWKHDFYIFISFSNRK